MFGRDNFHSTMVAWLKVVLPLIALGILSTLFLVSRTIDPQNAIPFAEVDVEDRIREPRLTAPTWAGVTDDGSALTVSAAEARPADPALGTSDRASAVKAILEMPGGARARMEAAAGHLDTTTRHLNVEGGVVIVMSTGYTIRTAALSAALDRTSLDAPGAVSAVGPPGELTAGAMHLSVAGPDATSYVLVFNGGVRLLYKPAD